MLFLGNSYLIVNHNLAFKMKYFEIDWDYDNLDVIGHYPQTSLKKGYNPRLPDSHRQVKPHSFPDFIPNLELELHDKAYPTDYIQKFVSFGMVVNTKFKNILKQFKLPPHAFYPIKVYHKGALLEYFWFHYAINDFFSWLDKEESKALIYDDKNGVYKEMFGLKFVHKYMSYLIFFFVLLLCRTFLLISLHG